MYNKETAELLRLLGVTAHNKKTGRLFEKIKAALERDPRPATVINAQLAALPDMADAAIEYAATHYPLEVDPSTNKPKVSYEWDPYTLSWVLQLQVAKDTTHALNGRPIIIRLQSPAANNDFSPKNIQDYFNSKFEAAQQFYPDDKIYQTRLQKLKQEFEQEYIKPLCAKFYTERENIGLQTILKTHVTSLMHALIAELSRELYRAASKSSTTYEPNFEELASARNALQQCSIELLSHTKRPIHMHFYYQECVEPNKVQALLNVVEPLNDVSSDKRDEFINNLPANLFKITNTIFKVKHNPDSSKNHYSFLPDTTETFYRSASDTVLQQGSEVDDTDDLDLIVESKPYEDIAQPKDTITQQRAMFRKLLLQIYKEQLVALYASSDIDEFIVSTPAYVNLSIETLLSPTFHKEFMAAKLLAKAGKSAKGTFITGNELAQLQELLTCLLGDASNPPLDNQGIVLNSAERAEIVAAIAAVNPVVAANAAQPLQFIPVIPHFAFFNVPVGKAFNIGRLAQVPIAMLDFNEFNKSYNSMGLKLYRRNILHFISSNEPNTAIKAALCDLFQDDGAHISGKVLDYNEKSAWKNIKACLGNGDIVKIRGLVAKFAPEIQEKLVTIVLNYTRVQDFHHQTATYNNDNTGIANGYMLAAASLFVLSTTLGATQVTCKSGKDRTGLFCLLREALLDADNDSKLIENICNAIRYSSAQTINAMNVPGCFGLQVPDDILDGLKELFGEKFTGADRIKQLLNAQQSKNVGALGKAAFSNTGLKALKNLAGANQSKTIPIRIEMPKFNAVALQVEATTAPEPLVPVSGPAKPTPPAVPSRRPAPRPAPASTNPEPAAEEIFMDRDIHFPEGPLRTLAVADRIRRLKKEGIEAQLGVSPSNPTPSPTNKPKKRP
jgi:hypothetical protein